MRLSPRSTRFALSMLGMISGILANTEIRNIKAGLSPDADVGGWADSWPVLDSRVQETLLALDQCSHLRDKAESVGSGCVEDAWVMLDFDDPAWAKYDAFTVKVSNPASVPVDIEMELLPPFHLPIQRAIASATDARLPPTRRQYAHVWYTLSSTPSPLLKSDNATSIPFNLAVEPLFLGVVPLSVVPLVATIPVLILLAHLATTYLVLPALDPVVRNARAEMAAQIKKK
ncbi:hypothetical protein PENSPDRAFT_752901 [Peniophora sp. CONT]|nr:hypothetical protein PENSPDRAFT_752901 [Peniophora sp. CONT]